MVSAITLWFHWVVCLLHLVNRPPHLCLLQPAVFQSHQWAVCLPHLVNNHSSTNPIMSTLASSILTTCSQSSYGVILVSNHLVIPMSGVLSTPSHHTTMSSCTLTNTISTLSSYNLSQLSYHDQPLFHHSQQSTEMSSHLSLANTVITTSHCPLSPVSSFPTISCSRICTYNEAFPQVCIFQFFYTCLFLPRCVPSLDV